MGLNAIRVEGFVENVMALAKALDIENQKRALRLHSLLLWEYHVLTTILLQRRRASTKERHGIKEEKKNPRPTSFPGGAPTSLDVSAKAPLIDAICSNLPGLRFLACTSIQTKLGKGPVQLKQDSFYSFPISVLPSHLSNFVP